jgi:hypothetical protein
LGLDRAVDSRLVFFGDRNEDLDVGAVEPDDRISPTPRNPRLNRQGDQQEPKKSDGCSNVKPAHRSSFALALLIQQCAG